jgi:hypothetical protein
MPRLGDRVFDVLHTLDDIVFQSHSFHLPLGSDIRSASIGLLLSYPRARNLNRYAEC